MLPGQNEEASRWVFIESDGKRFLAYSYEDSVAGPSAKGAVVSDPPSEAEIEAVIERPDQTFRDPGQFGARALSGPQARSLGLPAEPPWLAVFKGGRAPAPRGAGVRTVRGHVITGGAAAARARVTVFLVAGYDALEEASTRTGPNGGFQVNDVMDNESIKGTALFAVWAQCEDGAVTALAPLPPGDCDVTLIAEPAATLEGTVGRGGRPADARLFAEAVGEPLRRNGWASTDSAGQYKITGMAPGEYRIRVERVIPETHMIGGEPALRRIALSPGQRLREDFELSIGCALTVHVQGIANVWSDMALFTGDVPGLVTPADLRAATDARDATSARHTNTRTMSGRETVTTFHDVAPGVYTLCAWPTTNSGSPYPGARLTTKRVVVAEGTSQQRVDLSLDLG